tara:strand:+ start:110 stop:544 length:435 start_codon:yes stop_codon:yes gene_type:complete
MDKIIKNSNVGKKIILHFDNEKKIISKNIKEKENSIKKNEQLLISQKNILQEEEYKNKVDKIREEIKAYNIMKDSELNKFNLQKEKISKSFLIEINKVLREYAEKNNIDIILSSSQMLIGKANLDVTENILKEVNNKIKKFEIK